MKKNSFLIMIIVFFVSCSNNDDAITRINTFKSLTIDRIGKDSKIGKELENKLSIFSQKGEDFDFTNIKRTSFIFIKDLKFYLIPFKGNENKFIGFYSNKGNDIFTLVEKFNVDKFSNKYIVTNLNNKILYEYTIHNKLGIKDIKKSNTLDTQSLNLANRKYPANFNCGTLAFKECMSCGFDVCSQDWRCEAAAAIAGPAFVAGLAITCGLEQLDN